MCNSGQRGSARHGTLLTIVTPRAALWKLALQIERDVLTRKHLRSLLTIADAALLDRRREFRHLKARIAKDDSRCHE